MSNPINEAVEAYEVALRGHRGHLHLHLAPGFTDGFIDRGEGYDPVALRNVLDPDEEARLRDLAADAFVRAGRGEELRITADLEYASQPDVDALYTVTGSAQERFHERLHLLTQHRRAQGRLKGAASDFFGLAFAVGITCMALAPVVALRSDSELSMLLALTPVVLPWFALVVPLFQFRALGVALGMGAAERGVGGRSFKPNSTRSTIGRGAVTAWLAWGGAYAAVVGAVLAVVGYVAIIEDDWLGQPNTGEALGAALLGAAMVWGSTAFAVALTWLMALIIGISAMTLAPEHDSMFQSRDERTGLRLAAAAPAVSLFHWALHPVVHDTSWWPSTSGRVDFRILGYIVDDWQTGPIPGTSGLLVGGYWLATALPLGLLAAGAAFGLRDRIRRSGDRESEAGLMSSVTSSSVDAPTR